MARIHVSLDANEYSLVRKEARRLGILTAEFLRQAIRSALPAFGGRPWMSYAGLVESGSPQSSQSIDEIIYGTKS